MPRSVRALLYDLFALTFGFAVASLSITVLVAARATDRIGTSVPAASLIAPLQGQVVSGSISVSASANADTDALQFQLSGANLGPVITSGACSMNWNTAAVADGMYALTVLAFDGTGNVNGSPPVTVTVENSAPQITNVGISTPTSSSVAITWTTNQLSTSGADYGVDSITTSLPINWNLVTQHSVTLSGLSAATSYRFRVTSSNGSGLQATSAEFTFTTAAGPPPNNDAVPPVTPPVTNLPGKPIVVPVPTPPPATGPPAAPPVSSPPPAAPPPVTVPKAPAPPPAPPPPLVDPTTIDNVAFDPTLGILANTVVTLERSGRLVNATVTDSEGKYRFTGLFPGHYQVWAVFVGFRILLLDVTINNPKGGPGSF
jgi:hypothetical protein